MLTTEKILKLANKKGLIRSSDFVDKFGISRQYVAKLIAKLVKENELVKIGSTRLASYATPKYLEKKPSLIPSSYSKTLVNKKLEEHEIFDDIENKFSPLSKMPENIKSIFEYAFSEMMNNAIEHSKSLKIKFVISLNKNILSFIVDDYGIGVFRNIMRKRKLKSEIESIQDLLKGKTTTAPQLHSGEGIFFTSKVGNYFELDSYGYKLIVDNNIDDVFVKKSKGQKRGTKVAFSISIKDKHHLSDIFKEYTNIGENSDYGFDKTEIMVKLYVMGGVHISRSQARRVLSGLDKFKVIVMDYDRVPNVGQAFADEIYRVFKSRSPDIEIQNINMNEAVKFMIGRAENEAKVLRS